MLPLYVSSWLQLLCDSAIHMHQLQISTQNTCTPVLCYWSYVQAALSFTQTETEQLFLGTSLLFFRVQRKWMGDMFDVPNHQ